MDNPFLSLQQALAEKMAEFGERPKFKSQRAELFAELYTYYEKSYKHNSWLNYIAWLKANRFKHTRERVEQYKKSKEFRKKITIKSFCSFWLSFMKTNDLYYLISIAKDKERRKENFNKWLFWSIKSYPQET